MKPFGLAIAAAATLALSVSALGVRAQEAHAILVSDADFAAATLDGGAATTRRTLEWNPANGRWGISFGVESHSTDRETELKDVTSGIYYRLTKRLHIGGAVSLAPDKAETQRFGQPQMPEPRVKLETIFKF